MTDPEAKLVYVFLPEALGPIDRGDKYEDPIIDELERLDLGEVSGAGTQLGDEGPDGKRPIVSCGIDVDTHDLDGARAALRELLPSLGCPRGTQLQFDASGRTLCDEYDGAAWTLDTDHAATGSGVGISSKYPH